MDTETYASLQRVVAHYYSEEAQQFEECGEPLRHIFRDLAVLAHYLDRGLNPHIRRLRRR